MNDVWLIYPLYYHNSLHLRYFKKYETLYVLRLLVLDFISSGMEAAWSNHMKLF